MKACILLGAPGSGKGTQAKRLQSLFHIPHISTGDMLRQEIDRGSELGARVQDVLASGKLVSDSLMLEVIQNRFSQPDVKNGYVLDGYPRTQAQANSLEEILKKKEMPQPKAIQIDVPKAELMSRLLGRLSCSKCGAAFHKDLNPPKKAMTCDSCGSALIQRKDDTRETVEKRLQVYENETSVLTNHYKKKNLLVSVNGLQAMEKITKDIEAALEAKAS